MASVLILDFFLEMTLGDGPKTSRIRIFRENLGIFNGSFSKKSIKAKIKFQIFRRKGNRTLSLFKMKRTPVLLREEILKF